MCRSPFVVSIAFFVLLGTSDILGASDSTAAELKPATLAAYDHYVQLTEARMAAEVAGTSPFLWIDRQPANEQIRLRANLAVGRVVVERLQTRDGRDEISIPDGLVHHWIGTVLLAGVPLSRAMAFVRDYPGYPAAFGPMIRSARVLAAGGNHFDVAMRTETHKVVTVVIDANYAIDYQPIGESRLWTKSVATNVREVESAGSPSERARPTEQGRGYLWRLTNYCAFEERPEGTYEQCESISLSRGLPFGVGWMIAPFVTSVPREALEFTLGRVRSALVHEPHSTV
jgi:hypothetical protein